MSDFKIGVKGPYLNKELIYKIPLEKNIVLSGTDRLEIMMGKFEEFLDDGGGVPIVSTATGSVRFVYGTIQLLTAFALKTIAIFGTSFAASKDMGKWEKFNNRASYHMLEGAKNMGRALIEVIPFINLLWWFHIANRDSIILVERKHRKDHCCNTLLYTEQRTHSRDNTHQTVYVYADFARAFYHGELKRMHILNQLSEQ